MKMLRIISKREGFRRAGRAWSEAPTDVDPKELSKEELEALKNEPMLLISVVDVQEAKPGKDKGE